MTKVRTNWRRGLLGLAALAAIGGGLLHWRGERQPAEAATQDTAQLAATCNNVALTWPAGTPISTVAAAVSPAGALDSIWRLAPVGDNLRFMAWSPLAGAPNDYLNTATQLEAAFVCMRQAGTLTRPPVMR